MRYRVIVECSYVAKFDVLVDDDSEAMARIRARQLALMQEFDWSEVQGPQARVLSAERDDNESAYG